MELIEAATCNSAAPANPGQVLEAARLACQRIAPLWPLTNFVAVNPFVGLGELPFLEACGLMQRLVPGGMQMAPSFYREKYASGAILDIDLDAALAQAHQDVRGPWGEELSRLNCEKLKQYLNKAEASSTECEIFTVAEAVDRAYGTSWSAMVTENIAHFCSAYFDAGQSSWRFPWQSSSLFIAWREMAALDASPELMGLHDFRIQVKVLPESAEEAIASALAALGVASESLVEFLHKQLMSISGWAGHVQYRVREKEMRGGSDDSLLELLAVRLAYDAALLARYDSPALREFWPAGLESASQVSADVLQRYLWQLAHEHAWQRQLVGQLRNAKLTKASATVERPAVQGVFCIDVRSEILRRSLEAVTPKVQTLGFAGFFGMPIEYIPFGKQHGSAQCPVLLTPKFRVRETLRSATLSEEAAALRQQHLGKRITHAWNSFQSSAISCFSFVETAGLAFGARLFRDAFAPAASTPGNRLQYQPVLDDDVEAQDTGIALKSRIELALGALRTMGLVDNFARLVLFCGHGSETRNNPYGSGLDCGACGGHAGDANARVAAAILNDPAVRAALEQHGILIASDTWFLAGLHNTTTDEVTIFDQAEVPASHRAELAELREWLTAASKAARQERAGSLGIDCADPRLHDKVVARSRDWAEVRPEWGLAGNAAFIAAPRSRTRLAKLGGRVFLHDYDHHADPGYATLELIMVAPMVVANWINLQYYASTVNNRVFGSGNKVTHNVVGTLGVCQGNSGDLRTGLPLQSVHDGTKWIHEPLRLHVLLEASRERISAVLAKHTGVRQLVENGWLLLFSLESEGTEIYRYSMGGEWSAIE